MPIEADGISFEECRTVHDVFIGGRQYRELSGRRVSLHELSEYPLIMLEQAANSRRWVDKHFFANGIELKPQIELGAHDLLVDHARIGLGIACVTQEFTDVSVHDDELFFIELDNPVPERSIGVCYVNGIELSSAARRFIEQG